VLAVAAGATLAACSSSGSSPSDASASSTGWTLTIGMTATNGVVDGNMAWGRYAGTLLAALKPAGVDKITFATFSGGPQVQAALQSGAVQVAVTGDLPALQARGTTAGTDTRQIGFSEINEDEWLVGRKGGPTTVAGLAGGTIAAETDTVRYRFTYGLLEQKNLLSKVSISNLGTPQAVAALESGKIDATPLSGAQAIQMEQEGYPVIARADQDPTLMATEETTALTSFLNQRPGFATAWGNALTDTNKSIDARSAEFFTYTAGIDHVTAAEEKAGTPLNEFNTTPFPAAGVAQLESTYDFSTKLDLITDPFSVTSWLLKG
jgi:sulfonate transport system substrate-binding protein